VMGVIFRHLRYGTCVNHSKVKLVYSETRTRFITCELEDVRLQRESAQCLVTLSHTCIHTWCPAQFEVPECRHSGQGKR